MTTVTPSDRAGAASAKRPATIPTQRSGQALRLLVLGTGDDAAAFRERAAEAGAELAQRFSVRVTHVVVEEGIGEADARVVRARIAGLPVLGLAEGDRLFEEASEAGDVEEAHDEVGADGRTREGDGGGDEGDEVGTGRGAGADTGAADDAGVMSLVRPRAELVAETVDGGPSDVFDGSALEAILQFPPLPADEADELELEVEAGDEGLRDEAPSTSALMDLASAACACGDVSTEPAPSEATWATTGSAAMRTEPEPVATETAPEATVEGGTDADAGEMALGQELAPTPERTAAWTASSVAWALVPFVSLGLLTPVAIGYAAYRLRSRNLAAATACYSLAVVAAFAVSAVVPARTGSHSVISDLLTTCLAASWLGGTAHAFMIRRRVFE